MLRVAVPAAARRVLGATDAALVRVHGDERADGGAELHGDGEQELCGILSSALLRTEKSLAVVETASCASSKNAGTDNQSG